MHPHRLDPVLRHVRDVGGPAVDDQPDVALLARFVCSGDEPAFAALVRRHGPMVLGLCRRRLDANSADDAFQATFLVLAQKARRLRQPDRLGPWLYGVAYRVASRVRSKANRRKEVAAVDVPAPTPADTTELRPIIDAAITRLPAQYRDPVVFCYLEGLTNAEAAERLQCPLGTIATRLSRARDRLRVLLTRQGVAPSAGGVTAALTPEATSAVVAESLLSSTARWAVAFTAGSVAAIPTNILTLSREVATTMMLDKLKVLAVLAIIGASGAGVALSRQTGGDPPAKADAPPAVAKANEPSRGAERALPLALLRPKPPEAYRLDSGDILGVFVEGVLGDRSSPPPLTTFPLDQPGGPTRVPMIGYPMLVQENGMVPLPLIGPVSVRGLTAMEAQELVSKEYVDRKLVGPGLPRALVAVAKPRTYRITVVRRDESGHRIYPMELPAYENDVLSALARTGGLPTGDAIVIQRGGAAVGATADAVATGVEKVRIPLRVRPDQPLPFKPDDVILKTGDILYVDGHDEPAVARSDEPNKSATAQVVLTLAVAAPDGRILVQVPGGEWKMYDAAKLSATATDGKPVAAVADRLKAMTAVLVAADGKPPAAPYLQLVKPGTLVLTIKD